MSNYTEFTPFGDNIALMELKQDESGGIHLPEGFDVSDREWEVKAVSDKVAREQGLKVGDKVIAETRPKSRYITVKGEEWLIAPWQDVKAVYEC